MRERLRARDFGRERGRDAGAVLRLAVVLWAGRRAVLFAMAARPRVRPAASSVRHPGRRPCRGARSIE